VAIGAAAAVIADYDGGAGALLQKGITQLVQLFPARADSCIESVEYNRRMRRLQDQFADAVVYRHVMAASAGGVASIASISDELKARVTLFERTGRVAPSEGDPIPASHWAALMLGHQSFPVAFHPFAGAAFDPDTTAVMLSIPERLRGVVAAMPKVMAR
jgi:tryptophan halogenase